MAVTKAQVAQLYVALFNRAPEGAGLNAWFAAGATKTQAQLADDMLRSPAVQSYFNGRIDTDRGFVSNIYKNFLGKDYADDPAGIESWVRHLEAGHSRGETLVKLFEVAQTPEAIAAAPVAAAIFRNKTEVSAYMAEKIADIAQRDDGTYDYEPFQAIIRGTTDTNLEEQKAKVDQLASGQTPSTNKNLTAETDNIVGTDGDDTFNGVYYVGDGAKTSTLSSLDTLDAKGGKDTLNLTVQKNGAVTTFAMNDIDTAMRGVSNIENLNIRSEVAFTANPFTVNKGLDNLNIQTIGEVKIEGSSADTSGTDTKEKISIDTTGPLKLVAGEVTKEIIAKSTTGSVIVNAAKLEGKVSIDAGATTGVETKLTAAKVQEVAIKAKGDTTIDTAKATKVTVNLNDKANTLTIATSHPLAEATEITLSSLKLAAATAVAKATKISVTDVDFATFNISTDVENVDFSMNYKFKEGSTDDQLTAALEAANAKNLTLHAKADKKAFFTYGGANNKLVKAVIDGDAKNLTLDLSTQTALKDIDASAFTGNFAKFTLNNVENSTVKLGSGDDVVALTATANKQTIDGGAGTDLVSVTSNTAKDGAGDKVTFNNFEGLKISNTLAHDIDMSKWSGFTNITLADGSDSQSITKLANNSTITLEKVALASTKNLTLGIKDADTGTDDTVNLVLDPKDNTTAGIANAGNIIVKNIETVNITSKTNEAKTSGLTNKIILETGAAAADALKTITVKGDADTVLTLDATATKVKTVDASTLEGKFTFDGTAHLADKAVIKGGAKDDTITFGGKSGATVTGGAGNDTFKIGSLDPANPATAVAAFAASKVATIKDFSAGDKLHLGANAGTLPTNIVKYETSGSLDFANNLSRALDAAGGADKLAYFTYTDPDSNSTDTYLVRPDGNPGITGGDYVVKLAGTVNLDNARISNVDTGLPLGVDTLQITL
ncbi:DUF4214 domain-containing protein [uncultured Campylobacter sp.]|uniref:DUF4214 domain-containing protein n=1 Tax=uncultured Campylobacter sp. TaxID=218934 RepID=UPI0025D7BF67|nr:DUF4214 domain-containing protein [uncultured Campylobacter sp.]